MQIQGKPKALQFLCGETHTEVPCCGWALPLRVWDFNKGKEAYVRHTGAATFCLRRKSCLAWAGSAIRQECTRRQKVGEQWEITQRLMAEEIQYQFQTSSCILLQRVKGKWRIGSGVRTGTLSSHQSRLCFFHSLGASGCLPQAK